MCIDKKLLVFNLTLILSLPNKDIIAYGTLTVGILHDGFFVHIYAQVPDKRIVLSHRN